MSGEWFCVLLAGASIAERAWRYLEVIRFFSHAVPPLKSPPRLISVLQPVVSGDPTMVQNLEETLRMKTVIPFEVHYLADEGDTDALRLCAELQARFPERVRQVHAFPPPNGSPKMEKLVAALPAARGDVICVLDDDTVLLEGAWETVLPYLDISGVGLAFGLPYYRHFANAWSALVSCFVNVNSLLTYVPYTALTAPFTINGMFYVMRRETLRSVGDFTGLETILADDFAIAQRFREHGLCLAQTPLRHPIRTHVRDGEHYTNLLRRWFTAPRESLLRHLHGRDKAVLLTFGVAVNFLPLFALMAFAVFPSQAGILAVCAMLLFCLFVTAGLNRAYLGGAMPWRFLPMSLFVQLAFPLQVLAALLAPKQQVNWRGKVMEAKRGGTFHYR